MQLDPSEDELYEPADVRRAFTVGELTFGVVICHEGWRYPETVRWAARHGAQLVFHPHFAEAEPGAFRPARFADPANTFHEKAALCRAAENTIFFATVNCAGQGSPTTSAVARPDGTLLCAQPYGEGGLLFADLDLSLATGLLFHGTGRRKTVWKTERVNLPVNPEPNVTYHDVQVRLTVTSNDPRESGGDVGDSVSEDDVAVPGFIIKIVKCRQPTRSAIHRVFQEVHVILILLVDAVEGDEDVGFSSAGDGAGEEV